MGLSYGGNADVGIGVVGAGMNSSVGYGGFSDGSTFSLGGFLSGGAFAGGPGYGASYASCPSKANSALGAYAGSGGGPFITNANDVKDLSGPFKTISINIGIGPVEIGLQASYGENNAGKPIGIASLALPGTGAGAGAGISVYNTNTLTTDGGGNCSCEQ